MDWTGPRKSGTGDRRTGLIWLFRNATHTYERNDLRNTKYQMAEKKTMTNNGSEQNWKRKLFVTAKRVYYFGTLFAMATPPPPDPKVWPPQRNREFYIWLFGQDRLSERNWTASRHGSV